MSRKLKAALLGGGLLIVIASAVAYFYNHSVAVLNPQGPIGLKERNLILLVIGLSLVVVIPVYVMLIGFAWRYREGNKSAKYEPGFDGSRLLESIWWGVPLIIITILAVVTWNSSRDLDPFKPINSSEKPLNVQVVALQWKWLFIYPEQGVASVNFAELPVNRPISFEITSDAPMNSFWIPQLGGQIYAMSGMSTKLHLMASRAGDYYGSSANISGSGFSDMKFTARAVSDDNFKQWVKSTGSGDTKLNQSTYNQLAKPGTLNHTVFYSKVESDLYQSVVSKFEGPFHSIDAEGAS